MERTIFETDITAGVEVLRTQAGDRWRVPAPLLPRTMEYYTRHTEKIREHLNAKGEFYGFTDEEKNALLEDYARALFGVFDFTATRDQMAKLIPMQSTQSFLIDPYGLYTAVIGVYRDVRRRCLEYDSITAPPSLFRGVEVQRDAQRAYINGPNSLAEGRAISYLIQWGQFDAEKFAGATGKPAEVSAFMDRCALYGQIYDYTLYYAICKYCLFATADELEQVPPPAKTIGGKTPVRFAEITGRTVADDVERIAARLSDVLERPTVEKIQAATEQTKAPRGDILRVSDTFAAVLSRDVYGSKYGADVRNENDILPIQAFITNYMERHPDETGTVTPRTVEKTIEGVNLLQRNYNVKPAAGWYTYETTQTEFAKLCGYEEPNGDEIRSVFASLIVLRNLYLAVWKADGIHAVNILNVPDIGLTDRAKGKLKIQVSTDATKGRPQLLEYDEFERMRKEAKGAAQNHFRYQIIGKGHKAENALLDEIFGYTNAIREAVETNADAETVSAIRRNLQKNKPRDRKRLAAMFEKERAAGFLTYKAYTNAKGETIYQWERTAAATPQDPDGKQDKQE